MNFIARSLTVLLSLKSLLGGYRGKSRTVRETVFGDSNMTTVSKKLQEITRTDKYTVLSYLTMIMVC